jgi:hypothetical protein
MRRREFIASLSAAGTYAAVPHLARAQQGSRVRRLAVLVAGDDRKFGRNLQIDLRFAGGNVDRMRANAAN